MKKVVLAAFLACAVASCLPLAFAQAAPAGVPTADPCAAPQMAAAEFAVYNNANTQTDPKAKAAAFEQYLTQFPQSAVKETVLATVLALYSTFDAAKTLDAADRLLQVNPQSINGLYAEAYIRNVQAGSITDPAAKQAALDTAASYAQKGLAAPKPACMDDATFATLKGTDYPSFYSAIGNAAFNKKDSATAIDNFKKELSSVPLAATQTPGPVLLDTFFLGEAYMQSTPPDYLSCTFYVSRAVAYAPDAFKTQAAPIAKYCFHKYHGADDTGYDAVVAAATANLNPPDGFAASVKPAPTPADIVNQVIATTPDLSTLATGDKEFILANGTPDQAAKVWDTIKGKSFQFPNVLVIASTPTQVQVAISEDAVQSKTADFTFNLTPPDALSDEPKAPAANATPAAKAAYKTKLAAYNKAKSDADAMTAATAVGKTVTLSGTFDSYTPKPVMITMSDGAVILPKAEKTPVHTTAHPAAHKPAAH